jgi:hypothetical protein
MADFIPSREADLLTFAQTFSTTLSGEFASYGLINSDATSLATLVSAYAGAFAVANDPATRTGSKLIEKDIAKGQLVAALRSLSARIQANPGVTAAQRNDIGLPIRDRIPTPVPAPATKPVLELAGEDVCRHLVRIRDEANPSSRAKPEGSVGAQVFVFVGDNPPLDLEKWSLKGVATKGSFMIDYAEGDIGKKAHVAARWTNRTGEAGPRSDAVSRMIAE